MSVQVHTPVQFKSCTGVLLERSVKIQCKDASQKHALEAFMSSDRVCGKHAALQRILCCHMLKTVSSADLPHHYGLNILSLLSKSSV